MVRVPIWRGPNAPLRECAPVALRASSPLRCFSSSFPHAPPPLRLLSLLLPTCSGGSFPFCAPCWPLFADSPAPPLRVCFSFGPFGVLFFFFSRCSPCVFALFCCFSILLAACTHKTTTLVICCCGTTLVPVLLALSPPWCRFRGVSRPCQLGPPPLAAPLYVPRPAPPAVMRLSHFTPLTAPLWLFVRRAAPLFAKAVSFSPTRAALPPPRPPADKPSLPASAGTPPGGFPRHPSPPPSPVSACQWWAARLLRQNANLRHFCCLAGDAVPLPAPFCPVRPTLHLAIARSLSLPVPPLRYSLHYVCRHSCAPCVLLWPLPAAAPPRSRPSPTLTPWSYPVRRPLGGGVVCSLVRRDV